MCSCDRCTYARAAAIILYDFCESLEIPVMVYGHSTDYYDGKDSVELYSYAEFNGFDNDDKYRLISVPAAAIVTELHFAMWRRRFPSDPRL